MNCKSRTPCWPPIDEIDGETEYLVYLVEAGWCWSYPGWEWVANSLNKHHGNNRTPQACRAKYNRIRRKANKEVSGERSESAALPRSTHNNGGTK